MQKTKFEKLNAVRPKNLKDFFGQEKIKKKLYIFLEAAKRRNEPLEHILFYGPPGLGKTTLAHVIANEMGSQIRVTSGPAIERAGDLASILTNLKDKDILFIDEIHRLSKVVEETLYPAMEDYCIDIVLGKGPSARTLRLEVPHITVIGATTRIGMLSSPLRDRFGAIHRVDYYSEAEISEIIMHSSEILALKIDLESAQEISKSSRGTPRVANRLLRRIRDFSQVHTAGKLNRKIIKDALTMLEIDDMGLDKVDRKMLETIISKHGGGPVGIETIAATISEDIDTVIDVYEPYLLQIGFLKRTPRGRMATQSAYQHLNIKPPKQSKSQQELF